MAHIWLSFKFSKPIKNVKSSIYTYDCHCYDATSQNERLAASKAWLITWLYVCLGWFYGPAVCIKCLFWLICASHPCLSPLANTVIRACDWPNTVQISPRPLSERSMCTDGTLIALCIGASVIWITLLNVTKPFIWNWPVECCCYNYTHARSPKNLGKFKLMQLYSVALVKYAFMVSIPDSKIVSAHIWDHAVSRLTGKSAY